MKSWPRHIPNPVLIESGGRQCSRAELASLCDRLVRACREAGLGSGDSIAIVAPNCIEYVVAYLAVLRLGCYLVPINTHFTAAEITHILEDSDAKALIAHSRFAPAVDESLRQSPRTATIRVSLGAIPGFMEFEHFLGAHAAPATEGEFSGSLLAYTSATTGRPKGVRRRLVRNPTDGLAAIFKDVPGDEVHLCSSRLYHTPVLMQALAELKAGSRVVLFSGSWDAAAVLALIEQHQVTTALMVPTMFVRLLKLSEAQRARFDVSSLRYVVHTGAPCPIDIKRAMIQWWGPILWERYGSTEGGVTLVDSHDWLKFPGTVGRPEPGVDVKILGEDGRELDVGQVGEIYISVHADRDFEYKDDALKTRGSRRDGYYTVGDLGYRNAAGYLFICDRKIDLIISGGVNIYAAEVEQILIQHPAVLDCAVFAVGDEIFGEVPKAVVQAAPGIQVDAALTDDILQFLRLRLAKLKVPRQLEYLGAIPRDPTGKLYKRLLKSPTANCAAGG